ncbi:helix-turn-helix domain-containing protein [Lawsonibacter sp. LCP25S3_G6]|uniref:helix-turn-helix domain-containing protein n=1 Tax=unclassified Lawsonibacter TaxID=2617946 RepID=UPI003F951094
MTLSEKILHLRSQKGLSQLELAEQLGVSRQSVSKWETGQSVPDLDKLIKLADLFSVSVDELVREGERPQPEPQPEPQVVYVREKHSLTNAQRAGICVEAAGLILALLGVAGFGSISILIGVGLLLLGLPLLLAQKHPWIILGWMAVGISLVVFNPYGSLASWGLVGGVRRIWVYLTFGERYISYLYGGLIGVVRGLLTLVLLGLTWRAWKNRT